MNDDTRQRLLANPGFRVFRWTVPWIALLAVVLAVVGLTGEFRKAAEGRDGTATSTIDATSSVGATQTTETKKTEEPKAEQPAAPAQPAPQTTPAAKGSVAIALVEGILLRKAPSASAEVMDRLKNGTEMAILETSADWLRVKDPLGRVGWIRNNENLISVK